MRKHLPGTWCRKTSGIKSRAGNTLDTIAIRPSCTCPYEETQFSAIGDSSIPIQFQVRPITTKPAPPRTQPEGIPVVSPRRDFSLRHSGILPMGQTSAHIEQYLSLRSGPRGIYSPFSARYLRHCNPSERILADRVRRHAEIHSPHRYNGSAACHVTRKSIGGKNAELDPRPPRGCSRNTFVPILPAPAASATARNCNPLSAIR